jgi:16S rRNA pseudouridine516 synthase
MADPKPQRLDKVLAHIGIGSRKEIKSLCKLGRVSVNGEPVRDPAVHVVPERDRIEVGGQPVRYREFIYLLMNKPQGLLSATEDVHTKTVVDLLPAEYRTFNPFPVGRLDKDTEGLLLLTNDGQLAHRLLSPKKHVPKTYYARIAGEVTPADVAAFGDGVVLDDGYKTMPGELKILRAGPESEIELTIYEGKFHQVKRMFAAVGKRVLFLKRLTLGPLTLDPALAPGQFRELTAAEVAALQNGGEACKFVVQ